MPLIVKNTRIKFNAQSSYTLLTLQILRQTSARFIRPGFFVSHSNVPLLLGSSLLNNYHMKTKPINKGLQGNRRKQLLQKLEFALEVQKKIIFLCLSIGIMQSKTQKTLWKASIICLIEYALLTQEEEKHSDIHNNVNDSAHPQHMPAVYLLLVGTSVHKNMNVCTHAHLPPLRGALGKAHRSNLIW